jgi:hypothetical protein
MDNGRVIGKRQIGDATVVACVVFQTKDPEHLLQPLGEVLTGTGDSFSQIRARLGIRKAPLREATIPEQIIRRIGRPPSRRKAPEYCARLTVGKAQREVVATKRSAPAINSTPKAVHLINLYRSSKADHTRYRDATLYSSEHPAIFVE